MAELEAVYGADNIQPVLEDVVLVKADDFNVERFGGIKKAGVIVDTQLENLTEKILERTRDGKITIGMSAYGKFSKQYLRSLELNIRRKLKKNGRSVRLIPSNELELNTAVSHHNKLGLSPNKIEVILVSDGKKTLVAFSTGAQNITAYANRDQKRPKRDAFVGMLPPKLAQIMINLASGGTAMTGRVLLDPFCGTGVLLQEAALMGYTVYGTDLAEKMIDYTRENLEWLGQKYKINFRLAAGNAMKFTWEKPIDVVACETYLGQPFSAVPSPAKLTEVKQNCKHIITSFLKNLHGQLRPDTRICLAVPAWRRLDGGFTRLNLLDAVEQLGYNVQEFKHASRENLLYARDNQVVGRELLVLIRR